MQDPAKGPDESRRILYVLVMLATMLLAAFIVLDLLTDSWRGALLETGSPEPWLQLGTALAMLVVAIFPLPAEVPAAMIGLVFSPVMAVSVTWAAAMAGAALSYEIARQKGVAVVRRIVGERRIDRVATYIERGGWPLMLGLRLVPLIAFTAINWSAGLLGVGRAVFYLTTAIGIVPGAVVFTLGPRLLLSGSDQGLLLALLVMAGVFLLAMTFYRLIRAGSA